MQEAYDTIDSQLVETIRKSLKNIREYHEKQKQYSWFDTTPEGTMLGQKVTPLASAGVYVPGGKAVYPSSVLMNIVPAKIAGVAHVVMCTPCNKEGKVNPAVLVAAKEAGADLTAAALKDLTAALEKAQAALKTAETPDTEPNPTPTPAEKKLAAPTIKSVKASAAKAGVVVKVIVNAVEGADHYDIYRTVNGKTVLAGSTASGKLVFKDKKAASLKGIKRASYRAVAVSKDANVKASDNGAAKTVKFTANVKIKKAAASGKSVKLSWKRNKKATGYVIYRSTKKNSGYKRIKKINNNKTVSYQDKKIRKKGNYYYKIVTVKKGNASAMSTAKKVKVK